MATKEETKPAYDVERLAKDLGIQPASVRVALRKHEIEKPAKSYVWETAKAYDEVLKKLKAASKDDAKPEKAEKAEKKVATKKK